jgi:hypothetical protein
MLIVAYLLAALSISVALVMPYIIAEVQPLLSKLFYCAMKREN